MIDFYQEEFTREESKARNQALALNFSLLLYLSFSLTYLLMSFSTGRNSLPDVPVILGLIAFSIVASVAWNRSPYSAGRVILQKTNKFLRNKPAPKQKNSWWLSLSGIITGLLLITTLVLGVHITKISTYDLFSQEGMLGAKRIFTSLLNPNFEILDFVLAKMVETIFIAFMATAIAIPVAFVISFFSARNLTRNSRIGMGLYSFFRFISNFTRSVEPIIWAIIFSVWVGIGPFAGMLALMLHSVAALTKLYSEQIESIDHGPIEAIESTGANVIQVVWYAVVPQILMPYLSFTIYRWDINIRMATIIGLVGGGGVGTLLMQYQGLARWNEVGTIVLVIAAVVWFMDWASSKLREAIQ